jgi:hypothetical protein
MRELVAAEAGAEEDGQKEDELNEGHGDEHGSLHLADGFRLSSHSIHGGGSDHSKANGAAKGGESECEREK